MVSVEVTHVETFSASHRLHNEQLSDDENVQLYGKCNNLNGHGHNYIWKVTFRGPIDQVSGMVYNLSDLKNEMYAVLEAVDHKNLNEDVQYFKHNITTAENLIVYLWNELKMKTKKPELLYKMVLHETAKNSVTYYGQH